MDEPHGSWSRGLLYKHGLAGFSWEGTALEKITHDMYPLLDSHIRGFSPRNLAAPVQPRTVSRTIKGLNGPLVCLENIKGARFGDIVNFHLSNGTIRRAEILEVNQRQAIASSFYGTVGMERHTQVEYTGDLLRLPVSDDMLARVFDGSGKPRDGGPQISATEYLDINGSPINPVSRVCPNQILQTGISVIDVINTVTRGCTMPIFTAAGLPHMTLAGQILRNACPSKQKFLHNNLQDDSPENCVVIFAGIGCSLENARVLRAELEERADQNHMMFLNLANDESLERLITPRLALTAAEYFAFAREQHVMVIMTDMYCYADAIRELHASRSHFDSPVPEKLHPMYNFLKRDFASLYERSGCFQGMSGSITQIPILTLPNDSVEYPVPQASVCSADGQIALDRGLYNRQIWPCIDILACQSRTMKSAVGKGKTRGDHWSLANQLVACYAKGKADLGYRAVVGEEALSDEERLSIKFLETYETKFLSQRLYENRDLEQSLDLGWECLRGLPRNFLTLIEDKYLDEYHWYNPPGTGIIEKLIEGKESEEEWIENPLLDFDTKASFTKLVESKTQS